VRHWKLVLLVLVVLSVGLAEGCRRPSGGAASAEDAVARVRALPEVVEWIQHVDAERPDDRVVIEVDSEDADSWMVHAYEMVQDEEGGHSATFGWYEVDKAHGTVRPAMP